MAKKLGAGELVPGHYYCVVDTWDIFQRPRKMELRFVGKFVRYQPFQSTTRVLFEVTHFTFNGGGPMLTERTVSCVNRFYALLTLELRTHICRHRKVPSKVEESFAAMTALLELLKHPELPSDVVRLIMSF